MLFLPFVTDSTRRQRSFFGIVARSIARGGFSIRPATLPPPGGHDRQDDVVLVSEDWIGEAELGDAIGNLPDFSSGASRGIFKRAISG